MPPKSAIREIRINQNPFSAEFDSIGYGRIEILTKPGTDKLHGRVFGQGNDNVFNTGNPFTAELPSYYSFQYNGSVSGALSKWASFFVSVEQRNTQTDNVYSILGGPVVRRGHKHMVDQLRARLRAASSAPPITWRFRRASTCNWGRRTRSPCATSSPATT